MKNQELKVSQKINFKEQRKFVRIDANFVVSYYIYPKHIKETDMTLTRNLSLGGICFTTDKHFPPGIILQITLRLPKISHLVKILGEVVYVKQEKNKKILFDIGIKFVQIKEEDIVTLEEIINNCASELKKINFNLQKKKKKEKRNENH
ncbi:MAG: PilZ domain-containing protein [Candidatus Omnitrophota bacterium]